jgi:phytanoyl-CoA hydroxylase
MQPPVDSCGQAVDQVSAPPISIECERSYLERGFAVIEDFFSDEDLVAVVREIEGEVDRRARRLYSMGRLGNLFDDHSFEYRLVSIYDYCREVIDGFDVKYLLSPGLFQLFTCSKVLSLAQHLLGSDIVLNPTHRLRAKLPQIADPSTRKIETDSSLSSTIWHQDVLTTDDTDAFDMFTIWVPLVDTTVRNGCLAVMPDAFRVGRLPHRSDQGGRIRDDALPLVYPHAIPCRRRGIVIFNQFTPHCSLPNVTDGVRWSIDFRFHRPNLDTGRPELPAFLLCNRKNAGVLLVNYDEWRRAWIETLQVT